MKVSSNFFSKNIVKDLLIGSIVASLVFTSFPALSQSSEKVQQAKATIQGFAPKAGFADLIEEISPAVVHVAINGVPKSTVPPGFNFPPGSPFGEFFKRIPREQAPQQQRKRRLGIGSGFIISADGYVVTNNHVVDGGEEIKVTLANKKEYDAKLVGSDKETDLAVLKIDAEKPLPFVPWGDDDQSRVGDWVIAIGHPFGLEGGASASTGIVSAVGRNIQSGRYDNYIQSDAAINRGNSGGPLFNLDGQVIGVNTAILSPSGGSVGVGFSISSNLAKSVVSQLIDNGQVERGLIGVQISPVDEAIAESIGRNNKFGALVERVVPGKPADKAGIRAGDLIVEFNNKDIIEMRNLPRIVAETKVGKKVPVKIWRDGKLISKKIKVEKLQNDSFAANDKGAKKEAPIEPKMDEELGAEIVSITPEVREQYGLADDVEGVLLLNVQRNSLVSLNGLRTGDIVTRVDKVFIKSSKAFKAELDKIKKKGRKSVAVYYSRDNEDRFLAFRFE